MLTLTPYQVMMGDSGGSSPYAPGEGDDTASNASGEDSANQRRAADGSYPRCNPKPTPKPKPTPNPNPNPNPNTLTLTP